jgi:hypothetical protein
MTPIGVIGTISQYVTPSSQNCEQPLAQFISYEPKLAAPVVPTSSSRHSQTGSIRECLKWSLPSMREHLMLEIMKCSSVRRDHLTQCASIEHLIQEKFEATSVNRNSHLGIYDGEVMTPIGVIGTMLPYVTPPSQNCEQPRGQVTSL